MIWLIGSLLFLVLPGVEIWVFLDLGLHFAVLLLLSVFTGGVGWWYARKEGLDLWTELESDLANKRLPTIEGLDAMLMVLGGWALILPGLITDVIGGALMVPAVRNLAVPFIRQTLRRYLL